MPFNKVRKKETADLGFTLGAIRTLLAPREVLCFCCEQAGAKEADELGT